MFLCQCCSPGCCAHAPVDCIRQSLGLLGHEEGGGGGLSRREAVQLRRVRQSIAVHSQGNWSTSAPIISALDRVTQHNLSFLPCALLPSLPVYPKPANQWVLWGLKAMRPGMQVMLKALQFTDIRQQAKWSMPVALIDSVHRGTHHNTSLLSSLFCQICPKPAHSMGAVGP